MNEQIDALLSSNEDRKLIVTNRKLEKLDFLRVMMIINNRCTVFTQELKAKLDVARTKLLKE